jgi:hypothetical protein
MSARLSAIRNEPIVMQTVKVLKIQHHYGLFVGGELSPFFVEVRRVGKSDDHHVAIDDFYEVPESATVVFESSIRVEKLVEILDLIIETTDEFQVIDCHFFSIKLYMKLARKMPDDVMFDQSMEHIDHECPKEQEHMLVVTHSRPTYTDVFSYCNIL